MMKKLMWGIFCLVICLYFWNASWWGAQKIYNLEVQAHRGIHQTFLKDGVTRDSCTAKMIYSPRHRYIENTIESMTAALEAGASQIEIDIHPTLDGEFVVFHDWTLDCRTDGTGRVRDRTWSALQTVDIGYGYTADGGQSFPFRGQFIGAMPRLSDVLIKFPDTPFTVNIKSRSRHEAQKLMTYLQAHDLQRIDFVGHEIPISEIKLIRPNMRVMSRERAKSCLSSYMALGWSGYVPKSCHNMRVPVPINYRRLLWGWPYKFEARLNKVGSRSMLIGPLSSAGSAGIDRLETLENVPTHYSGIVFTNRAEVIAPALQAQSES